MRSTSRIQDLTGQKFNKLTVLELASRNPVYWKCLCDCGNITYVRPMNLKRNMVKSCGCLHHRGNPSHNLSHTRIYRIYKKIKRRCYVKDDPAYKDYGGRGIYMCDEWKESVENFYNWAMQNGYSDNLSIDRIDNNSGYSPENCRWATTKMQCNNRRSNIVVTIGNKTMNVAQWCEELGLNKGSIYSRIEKGWNPVEALTYTDDARKFKRKTG